MVAQAWGDRKDAEDMLVEKAIDQACCLVWAITHSTHSTLDEEQLKHLHEEIRSCCELVGATVVEDGATAGVIISAKSLDNHVSNGQASSSSPARSSSGSSRRAPKASAEDSIVRLGQLLCRWASEQRLPFGLRVGVHTGACRSMILPCSSRPGYYGNALSTARMLAETSTRDTCIHMSNTVKDQLVVLDRLPLSRSPATKTYYLEPWSVVDEGSDDDNDRTAGKCAAPNPPMAKRPIGAVGIEPMLCGDNADCPAKNGMTPDEFRYFLAECGVDIWRFGKGQALTLEDFYRSVMVDRTLKLLASNGSLEQEIEQVRVDLRSRDPQAWDHQLQLAKEELEDGTSVGLLRRLTIQVTSNQSWKDAVEQCLAERFGVPPEVQREILEMDMSSYNYSEERTASRLIPGIMTTYMTHEVVIRTVKAVEIREIDLAGKLGLPGLQPFVTEAIPARQIPKSHWEWHAVGEISAHVEKLSALLKSHGINTAAFSQGALNNLYDEVYNAKYSVFNVNEDNELERSINVVKVWLTAEVLSVEHVLVRRWEVKSGKRDLRLQFKPVSMRMLRDQAWEDAVKVSLMTKCGLDQQFQQKHFAIDERSYRVSEEVECSRTYHGLKTVYIIHEVYGRILNPSQSGMSCIGLPEGTDFTVTEVSRGSETDSAAVTSWCWKPLAEVMSGPRGKPFMRSLVDQRRVSVSAQPDPKRRLLPPSLPDAEGTGRTGGYLLQELMQGKVTDVERARNAARRIRDESYSCREFFEDCSAAFPELTLYLASSRESAATTSGRTADDEYQRTMGALFAFYWLMRLHLDGPQSFCFGVDSDTWAPLSSSSSKPVRSADEVKKRHTFLEHFQWEKIEHLFISAGFLYFDRDTGQLAHDVDRVLAMLVLTAIHDIMKVQALLPTVEECRGEWCGYKVGETVVDHDAALGYVLEFTPDVLTSFNMLPPETRSVVKFTQCKMEYNMGWLVQAEAPPGALFSKFKKVIQEGGASQRDIGFYFVHWLTDLAGAEPCPQEGCEKFVLKFPQKVLSSFLSSFTIVSDLNSMSETKVFEDYLVWRWRNTEVQECGPPPNGPGSIARLRLVVMAQGDSQRVLEAYHGLPDDDMDVLDDELARTGCEDQHFAREGPCDDGGGPAILIYYSPALMQKAGAANPQGALAVLAEVFRQARELFPLEDALANTTVTVRIDALKDLPVEKIHESAAPGDVWILQKISSVDAQVQRVNIIENPMAFGECRKALFVGQGGGAASPRKASDTTRRLSLEERAKSRRRKSFDPRRTRVPNK